MCQKRWQIQRPKPERYVVKIYPEVTGMFCLRLRPAGPVLLFLYRLAGGASPEPVSEAGVLRTLGTSLVPASEAGVLSFRARGA